MHIVHQLLKRNRVVAEIVGFMPKREQMDRKAREAQDVHKTEIGRTKSLQNEMQRAREIEFEVAQRIYNAAPHPDIGTFGLLECPVQIYSDLFHEPIEIEVVHPPAMNAVFYT